jgi:uncharacterized integral membrane protein
MAEPAPPTSDAARAERSGAPWGVALSIVLAVALVVFAVQNTQAVTLRFLGWEWQMPLVIVIAGVAVATIVLSALTGWGLRRRRSRRAREKAELRRLRDEAS